MLLTLKFFEKQADTEMELEQPAVAASAGCGFLYTVDKNAKIYQIDHNKHVISVESGLDQVSYIKAAQSSQDIIVATQQGNSFQIAILNSSNFVENSPKPGQAFSIPIKTKAKDANNLAISSNLTFLCFSNSLNEIHVFKEPYTSRSKVHATIQMNEKVTNLCVTESGIIFITTENSISQYNIALKTLTVISNEGVKEGFAFINSYDMLFACRNKTFTYYSPNGTVTHEIELQPAKVGAAGQYIYTASNVQISTSFQVIDLEYGLLLNSQNIGSIVSFVDYQWGALITINNEKKVRMFQEMKAQPKIDLLCKNLRFEMALKMTKQLQLGPAAEASIHELYADYLFTQHNFDAAIEHYIMTIGYTEPSHVIEKFVEPHHAENLAHYLVKLPRKLISKQHTTLLFNCYTKVRATGQLDKIVNDFIAAAERGEEPSFDIETAVDVLKRNGYKEQAMKLAKAFKHYSLYLQLLSEDEPNYPEMLKYMKQIPGEQLLSKLQQYGADMMDNYEDGREELTDFIVECCTKGIKNERKEGNTVIDPSKVASLFLNNNRNHFNFLYKVFKVDTEALPQQTWDVLIEMALRAAPEKVMELLSYPEAKYSQEQALIYMNAFNCNDGRDFLYEKMKLYHLILQDAAPEKCLEICTKFGEEKPSLWSDALVKIANSDCDSSVVSEFVDVIVKKEVLPFLTVIKVLQKSGKQKYKCVLPIVQNVFRKEQELLRQASTNLAKSTEKEEECKKTIERIQTKNFQVKRSRCEICGQDIEFESRHFFCGHSYHENCLGDSTEFCVKCRGEYEEIANAKIERMEKARKNEIDTTSGDGFQFLLGEISNSLFNSGVDMEQPDDNEDALAGPREFLRKLQY